MNEVVSMTSLSLCLSVIFKEVTDLGVLILLKALYRTI